MEWSGQRMKQGQLRKLKVSEATLLKYSLNDTNTYAETGIPATYQSEQGWRWVFQGLGLAQVTPVVGWRGAEGD